MPAATVAVRRLEPADRDELTREVDRARAAGEFRASSDAAGSFFLRSFDLDHRRVGGAFDRDELVGFISSEFKIVVVSPDRRRAGIGSALVELAVAMERDRGRPNVILGRDRDDVVARSFLEAAKFAPHSILWDLELPTAAAVPAPVWRVDVRARPFEAPADVESWVAMFNAAFADHATPLQLDASFITADLADPNLDDADTLLLEERASGRLVGFAATAPERHDGTVAPAGEIWTIGVLPEWQGRGLGRQLLRWSVERLRGIGVRDITLSVNGRNEHALRLYEDEGFVRTRTRERWARPVALPTEPR